MGRQNQCFTRALPLKHGIWHVKMNVLHVLYHKNSSYEMSKPTFYTCFAVRPHHMRRQNQRFIYVLYHQNLHMRRQNQRFTRVLPSELNMQDVKVNVLCVFSHQITYSNASSEHPQNGSWTSGEQNR